MGALCAWLASPAKATVMVATFNGTLLDSYSQDFAGDFGSPGSLLGKDFTLTVIYDTTLGMVRSPSPYDNRVGGSYHANVGPIVSAKLTINNISQMFDVTVYSYVAAAEGEFSTFASQAGPLTPQFGDNFAAFSHVGTSPNNLTTPYTLEEPCEYCGNFWLHDATGARTSQGAFYVTGANVAPLAVPEPSTWALLILGFGGVGATLRRQRTVVA